MASIKFDEGTKFETSMNLEEGEGLLFVRPPKNLILNSDKKNCQINLVITNKRIVTIPYPKFSGKYSEVSFYFKDIKSVQAQRGYTKTDESSSADFSITLKEAANKTNCSGDIIKVTMAMGIMNLFKSLMTNIREVEANNPAINSGLAVFNASAQTAANKAEAERTGASSYMAVSPNYAKIANDAKAKLAGMDFSKAGHTQIRDYIVDLIEKCMEEENK